jgi:hypothetical protein
MPDPNDRDGNPAEARGATNLYKLPRKTMKCYLEVKLV